MPGSLTDSLSMGEVPGSIPGSARSFAVALAFALLRYTVSTYLFDVVVLTTKVRDDDVDIRPSWMQDARLGGDRSFGAWERRGTYVTCPFEREVY
jgi:hypothetical protein